MKHIAYQFPCVGWVGGVLWLAEAVALGGGIEDRIQKSFTVEENGKLVVHADRGAIDVKTVKGNTIAVEVVRKVEAKEGPRADEILRGHKIEFSQEGNEVRIDSQYAGDEGWSWLKFGNKFNVRFVVSVPEKFNVQLKTAGGSVSVADLQGRVEARTSGGSLRIGQIKGPVVGKTSGGSIQLEGCTETVEVETSGGSITLGPVTGKLVARTSGGSIHIREAKNDVVAHTSGGAIDLNGASGKIDASTSGGSIRAKLSNQPNGDCILKTSGGTIDMKLAEHLAVNLDAKTSGGRVISDLPVGVDREKRSSALKAKLNGGGPQLVLKTSGGNIRIGKL